MLPLRRAPKQKPSPATTSSAPGASTYRSANSSGSQLGELRRELDDERLLHSELGQQLEPPFEGREQDDVVPEHLPRVRVEGHDRRHEPGVQRRADHGAMSDVDAVEGADRDRPRTPLELRRCVRDPHVAARPGGGSAGSVVAAPTSVSNASTCARRP